MKDTSILHFLSQHKIYSIKQISRYYPFNAKQLKAFSSVLDWDLISNNENIIWDELVINEFKHQLNWENLSANNSVFKDHRLIEKFEKQIVWKSDNYDVGGCIANNEGINWNTELIEKYSNKICFNNLAINKSVEWPEKLIDKYLDDYQIGELLLNENFKLNLHLFEKYYDINKELDGFWLYQNKSLMSDYSFISKYQEKLDWWYISASFDIPWKKFDILNKFSEKINWNGIANNEYFFKNDKDFFIKHLPIWCLSDYDGFRSLSGNKALPWSVELIENFDSYWDWRALSINEGLPWSIELIDKYENRFIWGTWQKSFDEGEECWTHETGLSDNSTLPWSLDFIEKYQDNLNLSPINESSVIFEKGILPLLNDEVVEKFLES